MARYRYSLVNICLFLEESSPTFGEPLACLASLLQTHGNFSVHYFDLHSLHGLLTTAFLRRSRSIHIRGMLSSRWLCSACLGRSLRTLARPNGPVRFQSTTCACPDGYNLALSIFPPWFGCETG